MSFFDQTVAYFESACQMCDDLEEFCLIMKQVSVAWLFLKVEI